MQGQERTLRALRIGNPIACCARVVRSIGSVVDNPKRYGIVLDEISAKVSVPGAIIGDSETEVLSERGFSCQAALPALSRHWEVSVIPNH
jgi:hypothetical protein